MKAQEKRLCEVEEREQRERKSVKGIGKKAGKENGGGKIQRTKRGDWKSGGETDREQRKQRIDR